MLVIVVWTLFGLFVGIVLLWRHTRFTWVKPKSPTERNYWLIRSLETALQYSGWMPSLDSHAPRLTERAMAGLSGCMNEYFQLYHIDLDVSVVEAGLMYAEWCRTQARKAEASRGAKHEPIFWSVQEGIVSPRQRAQQRKTA